jgi:hypothetical protein
VSVKEKRKQADRNVSTEGSELGARITYVSETWALRNQNRRTDRIYTGRQTKK